MIKCRKCGLEIVYLKQYKDWWSDEYPHFECQTRGRDHRPMLFEAYYKLTYENRK